MKTKDTSQEFKKWRNTSFTLLAVLMGVIFHAYIFGAKNMDVREAQEKYPLIDVARHLIPQKDFISTVQPLRERLRQFVASETNARISIYIEYLNTGANINLKPEDRFVPASLAKLPIALAVMGTVQNGIWSLDQVLTLEADDRVLESSNINTRPVGTKFTVRELLEELLIRSDNTAYGIFVRSVPKSEIIAVREAIGLDNLFDKTGEITSKEYSRLMRSLYTANYLNRENSEYLLELLNRAEFKDFLRDPVPDTTPFPHKYGMGPSNNTYNDSGIVYLVNRPYLITVMIEINGVADDVAEREQAARIMRTISNISLQFFSTANQT